MYILPVRGYKMDEETAKELCLKMREGESKGIWKIQCFFCNKFGQKDPQKYCFYNAPNFSGCNIINSYVKKMEKKGMEIT